MKEGDYKRLTQNWREGKRGARMKLLNRYPMLFCLFFGLLATPASANHALYTYGNPNTIQFCEVMQIDLSPDVLAPRNFVAYQDCGQAYPDPGQFQRHPYSRIDVILPDSRRFCSFVHHERFPSGDTTTIIDCRPMIDRR